MIKDIFDIDDLVMAIVYDSNSNIDQIYKDLRAIRNLKTLNSSDYADAYKIRGKLSFYIEIFKLVFKSKRCILEIDGHRDEECEDLFSIEIGDDPVFNTDTSFRNALVNGMLTIDDEKETIKIYGADLVKYEIATVGEIMWNLLWSETRVINLTDTKTKKNIQIAY